MSISEGLAAIAAAEHILPGAMASDRARVMQVAIGLQESRFEHRRQLVGSPPRPTGPAVSFWQFERGGGVRGVLNHHSSKAPAAKVCAALGVKPDAQSVWEAMQTNDTLGAAFARLLLYTDPQALPAVGDVEAAWRLYLRVWRPGAYDRGTAEQRADLRAKWGRNYDKARGLV